VKRSIRIGTSGWNYPHWKALFYPEDCPKTRWLEYYAQHFDTVELNATFYRLPKAVTFENWQHRTPASFTWSLKASRYITHVKRLKEAEEPLKRFYDSALRLGPKLGPILFQLPPSLAYENGLIREFLEQLDSSLRHVIEVRHPSWIQDSFFQELEDTNVAFCISDTAGRYPFREAVTADFIYIRLHGSQKLYASKYTEKELKNWAKKIKAWNRDTFIYFDNDFEAYAVANARRLKEMLK
jgi:uncharacterized protein YecE (DUF72 family)